MPTLDQLIKATNCQSKASAQKFLDAIVETCEKYNINTPSRKLCFLSQVGHESGGLFYTEELASGKAYEGRADLGNTKPGDGPRYKGRGLIQITGRANYKACGAGLGLDLMMFPELLEHPIYACRSAAWFWKSHGLNKLADAGDQIKITRRINGGTNGLAERLAYFELAKKVIA